MVWAWSGDADTSGFTTTQPGGTFAIAVPDGSYMLNIHAYPGEDCTFIGWYGPDGFTTAPGSATFVVVDGATVSGIEIILPDTLDDLPFIEWVEGGHLKSRWILSREVCWKGSGGRWHGDGDWT